MSLDTTGFLLEGIRMSTGNNAFTFPPKDAVTNISAFNASTGRAEYVLLAESVSETAYGLEIGDPDLIFSWTKNESVANRFDYDNFSRRWLPSPGGAPTVLAAITNSSRIITQVPDLSLADAPYDIYLGTPIRSKTFAVHVVGSSSIFTDPAILASGIVEISFDKGELNFSQIDINTYTGQNVIVQGQSFNDRTKTLGIVGQLPQSPAIPYSLFLGPRPGTGQFPRIRIGYRPYLTPIEVPNEVSFSSPAEGTVQWSRDTGKLNFSTADITNFLSENIYYDGVILNRFSLTRIDIMGSPLSYPTVSFIVPGLVGATDATRYFITAESVSAPRAYFTTILVASLPTSPPNSGTAYVLPSGAVYFNPADSTKFSSYSLFLLDTYLLIENGVTVQFFRSGANSGMTDTVSDFTYRYKVQSQIIVDGIQASPFVFLPTVPTIDQNLLYQITQAPSSNGTFTGVLNDGTDSTLQGKGYLLSLDTKQFNFSERKTIGLILQQPTAQVKIPDVAISPKGLQVTQNGNLIIPGIDFAFDASAGLLEFLAPVGENDPNNILNISGNITLPNQFTSAAAVFDSSSKNKYLFISQGPNAGIYHIDSAPTSHNVYVTPNFASAGPTSADLRQTVEIVADRFWKVLAPPYLKLTVSVGPSSAGPFTPLPNSKFTVIPSISQISITDPAKPGSVYQIKYVWLDSPDNGVTVTPTNVTEFALFKIRQESGVTSPTSTSVTFNPSHRTVNQARPIVIYADGVPVQSFQFIAPGQIILPTVAGTQLITIDYWVQEAPGGQTTFTMVNSPLDLDFAGATQGATQTIFNGDQTSSVFPGSPVNIDNQYFIVNKVSYDHVKNITNVIFTQEAIATTTNVDVVRVAQTIFNGYLIKETAAIDIVPFGSSTLGIAGNKSYPSGTIIEIDGEVHSVTSSSFDPIANKTTVTFTPKVQSNYIIPTVLKTIRPITDPAKDFFTLKFADISFPFTLILSTGTTSSILRRGVDYDVSEGGQIALKQLLVFGNTLYALYVSRVMQPTGTNFIFNYSRQIAPDSSNGLLGQRLVSSYDLYAPDSFFYRVESITTFLPEVIDLLQQSAQTPGVSGPNTQSVSSPKNKDQGTPSLYFDEQHLSNVDVVIARLLKFYNDIINSLEDILANTDGRVVGGTFGRFRFDGNLSNPIRTTYASITNDIDDQILLYNNLELTSVSPFTFTDVPITAPLWQASTLSRIYPIQQTKSAALNDRTGVFDFGVTMGSFGVNNIISLTSLISTPARSQIQSVAGETIVVIAANGNASELLPPFAATQKVKLYKPDGTPDISTTIVSITGTGPFNILLAAPTTLLSGSIMQDVSDQSDSNNHYYSNGRDLNVDFQNGLIHNFALVPPFNAFQKSVVGNEIIDCGITFQNPRTTPYRFPALDGSTLLDDGRVCEPPLNYDSENAAEVYEKYFLNNIGNGTLQIGDVVVILTGGSPSPLVGQQILMLNGLNAGYARFITSATTTTFTVSPAFAFTDVVARDFLILQTPSDLLPSSVYSRITGILFSNLATAPISPALIGILNSQVISAGDAATNASQFVLSGNGQATGITLTDVAVPDFQILGVSNQCYLFIDNGPNLGFYKIASAIGSVITIDPSAPYPPSFSTPFSQTYQIFKIWSMLPTTLYDNLTDFIQKAIAFYNLTNAWESNITLAGVPGRIIDINLRLTQDTQSIQTFSTFLGSGSNLYDLRYTWITQRTDQTNGTLYKIQAAAALRQQATIKLIQDQKKLLVTRALALALTLV